MVKGRNSVKKEYLRDSRDVRALGEFLREAVDVNDRAAERQGVSASNARQRGPSDGSPQPTTAQNSGEEAQSSAAPKKKRPIPGFRLKGPSKPETLLQLEEMFGDSVSAEVIEQVHSQMPDQNACIEALIGLTANPDPAAETPPPDITQQQQDSSSRSGAPAKKSLWDSLPPDCQLLIADTLTTKQLASAAPTCKSFALLAAVRFGNLDVIRCRRGCTFKSLPGMIASHQRATQLVLNGMSTDLRHIVHFESLSAALRRGVEHTARRRVPLTHLQLQGCSALDMDALQLLLDAVPTIQSLDISRCVHIDDVAVRTLAQYEPGPANDAVQVVLESMQLEASGYAHTTGTDPLRGAPAAGGGSIFLRRNGRDITFGSALRISPAVAALLQRHASARNHQDDVEPLDAPSSSQQEAPPEQASSASLDAPAAEGEPEVVEPLSPEPLPAGLTALMLKGCGANEAGVRALFNPTARCAKTLRVLDISECSGIKLSFLATLQADSALEVLRADSCNSLVSLNAKLPLSSALRELSVKRCSHLHTVELDAPALERLSVSNSTSLLGLSLTAPRLRQLYAVHCRNLQELFITEPPETSVLHEVNLEGCSSLPGGSMSALIAASPRLRLCNLMSCRQLAQLMVPERVLLEELNVSATALSSLVCSTTTLRVLIARRCAVLDSVLLAAPTELCDVHNCVKLTKVQVPADGSSGSKWHSPTVEVGGCESLSDGARRDIRTWAKHLHTT